MRLMATIHHDINVTIAQFPKTLRQDQSLKDIERTKAKTHISSKSLCYPLG